MTPSYVFEEILNTNKHITHGCFNRKSINYSDQKEFSKKC